jgi:AraC-like DNA-binding protein
MLLALVNKLFLQFENNKKDSFTLDVNQKEHNERDQFSMKFDEIVKQNISNSDFSVEDMAQSIGMSRTQLFRKVKQLYVMSPKDYLIKVRMHAAAELLQYNDSRITLPTLLAVL